MKVETVTALLDTQWSGRAAPSWERVDLGVTEQGLADALGVQNDKAFRQRLWQAREEFRERTGRQIVTLNGRLIVLAASEQARYAHKQSVKAKRKKTRALDVASSVPLEQLPEAERGAHVRRIEHMARSVAIEELAGRGRNVLAGLGDEIAARAKEREEEARSRAEARARLFGAKT
ncbi:hypothetical protein WMF30_10900 [Sorangium sp. So ce134]